MNTVDIQVALARKEFLQNQVRGYGANADGQFGPNTRAAIKHFQRSTGAQTTGFLSNEQRAALITPTAAQSISKLENRTLCANALNAGTICVGLKSAFSKDVAEVARRGLTVDACRRLVFQPYSAPTSEYRANANCSITISAIRKPSSQRPSLCDRIKSCTTGLGFKFPQYVAEAPVAALPLMRVVN